MAKGSEATSSRGGRRLLNEAMAENRLWGKLCDGLYKGSARFVWESSKVEAVLCSELGIDQKQLAGIPLYASKPGELLMPGTGASKQAHRKVDFQKFGGQTMASQVDASILLQDFGYTNLSSSMDTSMTRTVTANPNEVDLIGLWSPGSSSGPSTPSSRNRQNGGGDKNDMLLHSAELMDREAETVARKWVKRADIPDMSFLFKVLSTSH